MLVPAGLALLIPAGLALLIPAGLALLIPAARLVGEGRLLAGVVAALLMALEVGLLLRVQMLLVPTALELIRVYAELIKQSCVLLRIYLIESLQLLRGLLVISTELADQIHDLVRIKRHDCLSFVSS